MLIALLLAATVPGPAADAELTFARYRWHRCVTLAALDEIAAGAKPGYMTFAADSCPDEEKEVERTISGSIDAIDGDLGFARQQLEAWRAYEIKWALALIETAASVPPAKAFPYRR